ADTVPERGEDEFLGVDAGPIADLQVGEVVVVRSARHRQLRAAAGGDGVRIMVVPAPFSGSRGPPGADPERVVGGSAFRPTRASVVGRRVTTTVVAVLPVGRALLLRTAVGVPH